MNPLLRLEDLKYHIGNKLILSIPCFSIESGEFLGIMGPNGAGKSTLLKIISLLEKQSEGNIIYKGETVLAGKAPMELRRKFSIALQQSLLLDTTVFQNIAIGLKLRHVPKKVIKEKVTAGWSNFKSVILRKKMPIIYRAEKPKGSTWREQ